MNNTIQQKFVTIDQACIMLQVSRPMIYRLFKMGKLSAVKLGAATRIKVTDIDKLK